MDIVRRGNDINVTWAVFGRNGHKYSLTGKVDKLWLVSGPRKKELTAYTVQARNELVFVVDADDLNRYGTFKLLLQIREPGSEVEEAAYDLTHVFQVVSESYPMTANNAVNGQVDMKIRSILKNVYVSELEGASAYEIAVENGFEGSESEWLLSLIGIQSIEQTASSSDSGGLNQVTVTLAGGSVETFSWYNGAQGAVGSSTLNGLSDVTISSPSRNQVLTYNGSKWVNGSGTSYTYGSGIKITSGNVISANIPEIASGLIAAGYSLNGGGEGGGGGATTLAGLSDVDNQIPVDQQVLGYDASISKWRPMTIQQSSGGGGGGGGGDSEFDPTILADYVTIAEDESITGQKTFSKPIILTDSIMIGQSNALVYPDGTEETKMRIYFGDKDHYIEYNAANNGYLFYGGGIYTNSYVSAGGVSSGGGGGGGGATSLAGLTDVADDLAPEDGEVLVFRRDASDLEDPGQWVSEHVSGIGDYLPLSGGTMSGIIKGIASSSNTNNTGYKFISFDDEDQEILVGGIGAYRGPSANNPNLVSIYAASRGIYSGKITLRPNNSADYGLEVQVQRLLFNGNPVIRTFYGTCSTGSSTLSKTVTCAEFRDYNYSAGTTLFVLMSNASDTTGTVQITISGVTGTKSVFTSDGSSYKTWKAGELICLVYTGTDWRLLPSFDYIANHAGGGSGGSYSAGGGINISDNQISVAKATNSTLGGILLKYAARTGSGASPNPTVNGLSTDSDRYYWIEMNSSGQLFVNVPWVSSSGGTSGVSSVVSKTGDVTTTHIANALTAAGYKLTDTTYDLSGYLPLSAGSGKKLTGDLYSQTILPKTSATYNLGGSSNYWNYEYVKRIYLASGVYIEYDSTNQCVRVYGAGLAVENFITAGA